MSKTSTRGVMLRGFIAGRAWCGFDAEVPFAMTVRPGESLGGAVERAAREHGGDFVRCGVDVDRTDVVMRRASTRTDRRSVTVTERTRLMPLSVFGLAAAHAAATA
jgi:hypothetical protein